MSNYDDIEMKIMQYVQWLRQGDEIRRLNYPRCIPTARQIPNELPADAVPSISDDEGLQIGRAMLTLKSVDKEAHSVIVERYFWGVDSDERIGKRLKIGNRNRVAEIRRRAFSCLKMYFETHDISLPEMV